MCDRACASSLCGVAAKARKFNTFLILIFLPIITISCNSTAKLTSLHHI